MSHHQVLPYRDLDQRTADGLTATPEWKPRDRRAAHRGRGSRECTFTFGVRAEGLAAALLTAGALADDLDHRRVLRCSAGLLAAAPSECLIHQTAGGEHSHTTNPHPRTRRTG